MTGIGPGPRPARARGAPTALAAAALLWCGLVVAALLEVGPVPGGVSVAVMSVGAAVVLAVRAVRVDGAGRRVFAVFATAQGLFGIGDTVWAVQAAGGAEGDAISLADPLYLLGYPTLMAAMVLLVVARGGRAARDALADGLIVGIVAGMVISRLLIDPASGDHWFIAAAYPTGDAILLACAMWLVLVPGRRDPSLWLLVGHLVVLVGADVLFALDIRAGGDGDLPAGNALYVVAYGLIAAVALHPSARRVASPPWRDDRDDVLGTGRIALLGIGVVAPAVAALATTHDVPAHLWGFLVASVALSVLLVTRMSVIVRRAGHDRRDAARSQATLAYRAAHDTLTGLANRRSFVESLEAALTFRGPRQTLAVMFIDLDEFKLVNDSYGHVAGDALLSGVAARLADTVRRGDLVARLGGDEFTVLARDLSGAEEAEAMARRILDALDAPFELAGGGVYVTASVGIALAEPGADADATGLMRDADIALYRAKDDGRNRFRVFGTDMRRWVAERHRLENDLRRAVDGGELHVEYQPQVDLSDGRVVGVEALVRWEHPDRGRIAPAEFIPVAEATGLIVPIGEHVLRLACRDAARWNRGAAEPLRVSVNVSVRQLAHAGIVDAVRGALEEAEVAPGWIVLELTETALAADPDRAVARLLALRRLGVGVELDDFGVGQSSLAALRTFPLDAVKIDRGFMEGVGADERATQSLGAVVTLARALGLDTVAEGVETPAQSAALRALGCDRGQGFLFSRPLPVAEVDRLVSGAGRARAMPVS